jgi:hypothetical protein
MNWTPEEIAEWTDDAGTRTPDWLVGRPMDPEAVSLEPLPTVHGFPFLHPNTGALVSGPTGKGRSSLMQVGLYDAARVGVSCLYLGVEVTAEEFDARAGNLADVRGDDVDDALRDQLSRARYVSLTSTIARAWEKPDDWVAGIKAAYTVVVMDPLSSVAGALGFNFDKGNSEYIAFYDRLVQPLADAGVAVRRARRPRATRPTWSSRAGRSTTGWLSAARSRALSGPRFARATNGCSSATASALSHASSTPTAVRRPSDPPC